MGKGEMVLNGTIGANWHRGEMGKGKMVLNGTIGASWHGARWERAQWDMTSRDVTTFLCDLVTCVSPRDDLHG